MSLISPTAMVLAAGLGQRMRPLTLAKPKPLYEVGGRTMLDHALDRLVAIGIKRAVVNTHYLAEQVEAHLKSRKDIQIIISREETLLDTGGAIAKALPYFEGKPFFSLNADLPWIDGKFASLSNMRRAWNPEKMDVLLLVMETKKGRGFDQSKGDFRLEKDGRLRRKDIAPPRPYVCLAAQILKPEFFLSPPGKVFSNNIIWDRVEAQNRLYGIPHGGTCYHVGTPEDWTHANELLESKKGWSI